MREGAPLTFEERLAIGNLRRDHDGLLSDILRLSKDRDPEPEDYPEPLFTLASRIRYLLDRI